VVGPQRSSDARIALELELGIDVASDDASVALLAGDEVLAEQAWRIETTATRELLGVIEAVLTAAGVSRDALTAIAVVHGPGGYSSLRASVATAQGMALGLDVPLAGVGRLELAAFAHLTAQLTGGPGPRPVVAVHGLTRGQLAWAAYTAGEAGRPPRELIAPRIDDAAGCIAAAPPGACWCGDLESDTGQELRALLRATKRTGDTEAPSAENRRRASDAVRLARLHDAYGDPAAVDVLYLRPPSITPPRPAGDPPTRRPAR